MGLVTIHPTTRGSPLQSTNCVSSLVTSCLTPYLNNAVFSSHCEVLPVLLPYQAFFFHCGLPSCYDHCACLLTLASRTTASTLVALLDWIPDCLLPPVPPTTILPCVLDWLLCVNKLPAFGSTLSPCHHLRLPHINVEHYNLLLTILSRLSRRKDGWRDLRRNKWTEGKEVSCTSTLWGVSKMPVHVCIVCFSGDQSIWGSFILTIVNMISHCSSNDCLFLQKNRR